MRKTTSLIALFIAAVLMAACGRRSSEAAALLARADSLMTAHPDSAYRLLDSIRDEARTSWRRAERMRYELTLAEAMNKAYKDFTTDSVLQLVVRYYDRHGSRNDQLKAHYLLGCAYRDMGEAPAAINAWQEAVDCADTLSTDCDYNTLYRVYGQMAEIYLAQQLYTDEIHAYQQYSHFAKKAGDTNAYLRGKEFLLHPYYQQQDTAAVFQLTEEMRNIYLENGMEAAAARVLPVAISIAVQFGMFERADSMMQIFESQSGLFSSGNIVERGYQLYYQSKGLYYIGINKLDSAEHYFRKLLGCGFSREAYHGLRNLYQHLETPDSVAHYASLYDSAINKEISEFNTKATKQAEQLYTYKRYETKAISKEHESRNTRKVLVITATVLLCIIGSILILYAKQSDSLQKNKKITLEQERLLLEKDKESENLAMQNHTLTEQLEQAQNTLNSETHTTREIVRNTEQALMDTAIFRLCKEKTAHKFELKGGRMGPVKCLNKAEWCLLSQAFQENLPEFYHLLTTNFKPTTAAVKVSMLFRLQFEYDEIMLLMGIDKSRISKLKRILCDKLSLPFERSEFLKAISKL